MTSPAVSIVIPCYNGERHLAETLESALASTGETVEVIVVDDGSTDGSRGIAARYASRGVRLIEGGHRGAGAARNAGIRVARGEFLQFLDADDLLSPDKIASQVAILRAAPRSVATCAWLQFTRDIRTASGGPRPTYGNFTPLEYVLRAGDVGMMMHTAAWLVPRAVADAAGPWYAGEPSAAWPGGVMPNDDAEYFTRVVLASEGVRFSPQGRSYYRGMLWGSLSKRRDAAAHRGRVHAMDLITRRLLAFEDSPRVRRACANHYQRLIHRFYPMTPDLLAAAEQRVRELGGSDLRPPQLRGRAAAVARLIGWRNLGRLRQAFQDLYQWMRSRT
jgi:glycosyltransferase involved in cell wall biosynthesis